jgi:N-acetyl sugar amidotransferase
VQTIVKEVLNRGRHGAYRMCRRCVMDTSDANIQFDAAGVCNHCRRFDFATGRRTSSKEFTRRQLESVKREISGAGAEHNCVIGLSGGVDSSYLAYLVVRELGFRPLAVHLDNGWNSRLAVQNIQRIVRKLDIDLITHVIDWEEFKDLQRAYFYASVIDIEVPTDHAINAILYKVAADHGIQYLLMGTNRATEHIMPLGWNFIHKNDLVNLRDIHGRFGKLPLETFPQMGSRKLRHYKRDHKIKRLSPLNWIDYVKADAKEILQTELGWKDYGGKHFESLFTKIYQGHILVEKFGVDKRRAHLATLVISGQISREAALAELETPPYPPGDLEGDLDYLIKKLEFGGGELERIMAMPPKSHMDYATDLETKLRYHVYRRIHPYYQKVIRRIDRVWPG